METGTTFLHAFLPQECFPEISRNCQNFLETIEAILDQCVLLRRLGARLGPRAPIAVASVSTNVIGDADCGLCAIGSGFELSGSTTA